MGRSFTHEVTTTTDAALDLEDFSDISLPDKLLAQFAATNKMEKSATDMLWIFIGSELTGVVILGCTLHE